MRKVKEKTGVDKALDLLFESGVDGAAILGQGGLLKELTKGILERALKAEMEDHLGYNITTPDVQTIKQHKELTTQILSSSLAA